MIRALAVAICVSSAAWSQTVEEPRDYRNDRYRAPVPIALSGATTIGPAEAYAIWQTGKAGFIDVLPQPPKPTNLPEGTLWREKPRHSIPGAVWLPNVGYGLIADGTADYYRSGLEHVTGSDPARPVVLFCLADCWMSWNAAKRAIEWGYEDVYWFPEGTDGWAFLDYPLEQIHPMDGQPQAGG